MVVTPARMTAIDIRTGVQDWTQRGSWQTTVMADDRLIAVDDDGRVGTVSVASGAVTYPIDTTVDTPTALAADGNTLYVGQRDGTVLSLDLEAGTTS
ncbi:hypothetical protein BH23ACT10_BH23ACT10_27580 [soil metagenome]